MFPHLGTGGREREFIGRAGGNGLRQANLLTILDLVREHGPTTRSNLSKVSGLSVPTVARVITDLERRGLVRPVGHAPSVSGRRAELVQFDASTAHVVGVDVGEVAIRVALADLTGKPLAKVKWPTEASGGVHHVLDRVAAAVTEVCETAGHTPSVVEVGYPGLVDTRTGRVSNAPHIPGSNDLPILEELQRRLPQASVGLENDVNLAAFGECWRGAGIQYREAGVVAFLSFRTGIGAGIVIDGRPFRGARGGAGEVAYLCGDPSFILPAPDAAGWIETRAGGLALLGRYQSLDRTAATAISNFESLVEAAANKNPIACQILDEAIEYYGLVVAGVAAILDPALIIVGGVVPDLGSSVFQRLLASAAAKAPNLSNVRLSMLGLEATMHGAVFTAITRALETTRAAVTGTSLSRIHSVALGSET